MAKEYAGDTAIRPLEKLMNDFCRGKGYDANQVFTDFLDYLIGMFDPYGGKIEGWRYSKEENGKFYQMALAYFNIMVGQIEKLGWYDAFGDLFMALHQNGNGKGQFFTPASVCNAVASVNMNGADLDKMGAKTTFGKRIIINDPAAGSSRLLLAGNEVIKKMMRDDLHYDEVKIAANRPYLIAEDLDYNCVKMSAINIMVHGCFGEAVCHDTLSEPDAVRLGYVINETMWPFPTSIPSIRKEMKPERFVSTAHWIAAEKVKNDKPRPPEPKEPVEANQVETKEAEPPKKKNHQYKQLSLW